MNDVGLNLNISQLILKLIEIGRSARNDAPVVRPLVIEAEDYALQLQRDVVALLHENEKLRIERLR